MYEAIDRSDTVWIVVASNNSWGASNRLHTAMKNARLPEPTSPAEFFAKELEFNFDLSEVVSNWNDYGREESALPSDEELVVIIYKFDPGLWKKYEVSGYNGSVTFIAKEGMEFDQQAEMDKATIAATYKDGVLSNPPKTAAKKAA